MGLDLHAQFGDEALARLGEQLRQGVGGDALHDGGGGDRSNDPWELVEHVLGHDVVDEVARGGGQDEPAGTIDDHQEEAAAEEETAGLDELPDLGEDLFEVGFGAGCGELGGGCCSAARGAVD